jgi:uncharacterized protein
VTVWGSGPGGRTMYDWPERLAIAGFAVYTYDRPGSGESSGDWRRMDFDDRAAETLAAVAALTAHQAVDGTRVALFGGSQGGWIAPLAASRSAAIGAVVAFSGPGTSPAVQERYRIGNALTRAGLAPDEVAAGLAYLDQMYGRLRAGAPAAAILADAERFADEPWAALLREQEPTVEDLDFLRPILDYDPLPALRAMRCPYLAIFGADDPDVPVADSVRIIGDTLGDAGHPDYRVVAFPGADHGIRPIGLEAPRGFRAPGFFELVVAWLTLRLRERGDIRTGCGDRSA